HNPRAAQGHRPQTQPGHTRQGRPQARPLRHLRRVQTPRPRGRGAMPALLRGHPRIQPTAPRRSGSQEDSMSKPTPETRTTTTVTRRYVYDPATEPVRLTPRWRKEEIFVTSVVIKRVDDKTPSAEVAG